MALFFDLRFAIILAVKKKDLRPVLNNKFCSDHWFA
jgi:hypothetical protein